MVQQIQQFHTGVTPEGPATANDRRVTVLILGGCGNLGRHTVKLLMEKGRGIHELRVLDCVDKPKDFNLVENGTKVEFIKGDIRNMDDLRNAFRDVTVVVHSAAVITSNEELINDVNIKGTENVIEACLECNVPNLVYTSSTEISRDCDHPVIDADEDAIDTRKTTETHILNGYTHSKQIAEDRVRNAEGKELANGKPLRTLILRPCGIYGDGDKTIIPKFLRAAWHCGFGFLPRIGGSSVQVSLVYVGNAAWAHVCAVHAILENPAEVTGKVYNVTDDTPLVDYFTMVRPFMEAHNMKLLQIDFPLYLAYYLMVLVELFLFIVSPLIKVSLPVNKEEVWLAGVTTVYVGNRCRVDLDYQPYYSHQESYLLAYQYYASLQPGVF